MPAGFADFDKPLYFVFDFLVEFDETRLFDVDAEPRQPAQNLVDRVGVDGRAERRRYVVVGELAFFLVFSVQSFYYFVDRLFFHKFLFGARVAPFAFNVTALLF